MGESEPVPEFKSPARAEPVGARLREARNRLGLDLEEIGARTRIPMRHLAAIEAGDYSALPSTTYAMGFARAYARAVNADEPAIAHDLRAELAATYQRREPKPDLETIDTGRGPSGVLVWAGALLALLLVVGLGLAYGTGMFGGGDADPVTADAGAARDLGLGSAGGPAVAPSPTPVPAGGGQVTLAATDAVWVRIYDAADTTLFMREMKPGERFDVPANANNPMINVGRPDKLAITVNGSAVAPLGTGERAIKDVRISAEALQARGAGPTPAPSATPTAGATVAVPVPPAFAPGAGGR